jgi:hypothetical protein
LIFKNIIYLIGYINNFLFFSLFNYKNKELIRNTNFEIIIYLKYTFFLNFFKNLIFYFLFNNYLFLKYLYFFLISIIIYLYKVKKNNLYRVNNKLIFLINIKIKKYIFEFNIYKFFKINLFLFLKNIKNNFSLQYRINFNKLKNNLYYLYITDMIFLFFITSLYGIKNLFNNFIL